MNSKSAKDMTRANNAGYTKNTSPSSDLANLEKAAPIDGPNTNPIENAIPTKACEL